MTKPRDRLRIIWEEAASLWVMISGQEIYFWQMWLAIENKSGHKVNAEGKLRAIGSRGEMESWNLLQDHLRLAWSPRGKTLGEQDRAVSFASPGSSNMPGRVFANRTSYIIFRAQGNMKMQNSLFKEQEKNILEVLKYKLFSFWGLSLSLPWCVLIYYLMCWSAGTFVGQAETPLWVLPSTRCSCAHGPSAPRSSLPAATRPTKGLWPGAMGRGWHPRFLQAYLSNFQ